MNACVKATYWLKVLFVLIVGVEGHGKCELHLTLPNGTPLDGFAFLSKMLAFFFLNAMYAQSLNFGWSPFVLQDASE